eukprot:GHRR01030210.1.p1 GENE.GHRR01030210.1~~GHRR01030210.1.p1  ORF type:complete len:103 (-),score=15.86 GHRR01030210.1:216-524(-)
MQYSRTLACCTCLRCAPVSAAMCTSEQKCCCHLQARIWQLVVLPPWLQLVTYICRRLSLAVRDLYNPVARLDDDGVSLPNQLVASPGAMHRIILNEVCSTLS